MPIIARALSSIWQPAPLSSDRPRFPHATVPYHDISPGLAACVSYFTFSELMGAEFHGSVPGRGIPAHPRSNENFSISTTICELHHLVLQNNGLILRNVDRVPMPKRTGTRDRHLAQRRDEVP